MAKPYVPYTGPVVTRAEAIANDLTRYFTGIPCRRGHISQRRTVNHGCTECEWKKRCREARNAASRAAYDPENARAYYQNRREELLARAKARYDADPETHKARVKAWRLARPDEARFNKQASYAANKEIVKQRVREWCAANPEATRSRGRNYRARFKGAEGSHTGDNIKTLFIKQRGRCIYCNVKLGSSYHVDHIVPLARGGSNWPSNLQLTCDKCNNRKRATDPIIFAQRLGKLL